MAVRPERIPDKIPAVFGESARMTLDEIKRKASDFPHQQAVRLELENDSLASGRGTLLLS
jgi:hypothetical protein